MKQNINEELNYIKYLLGYKKGVVISEQETTPETPATPTQQGGDGCIPLTISGKFNPKKTDSTEYLTNIIAELDKQIKGKPEFQGGTVTSMRIIGGASNVDNGVKSDFTLNNDYTPRDGKPNETKEFQNNMGYAQARINATKQPILDELQKVGLTVSVEPTTEAHVIDTGGASDVNRNTTTHPKEGQVVIIQITVCPVAKQKTGEDSDRLPYLKPQLIPTNQGEIIPSEETLRECYENSRIRVYYQGTAHHCNYAVYNIFANGIQLKRETGEDYASLNNIGKIRKKVKGVLNDKQVGFDDAEILPGSKYKKCGRGNECGRSNTFVLDKITNESFFNRDVLFKNNGALVITAACTDRGQGPYNNSSDCHTNVGQISFKITGMEEKAIDATDTPNMFDEQKEIGKFDACKTYTRKAVK